MLTAAFIYLAIGMIISFTAFLPTFNPLPGNIYDLITYVVTLAYGFDFIIPMSTVFQIFLAGIYIHLAMFSLDLLFFLLKQTRLWKV